MTKKATINKKTVAIGDLKAHPKNPKKHDLNRIKSSIGEFGYGDPIVVDELNTVLSGHGRLEALKDQGFTEIDVQVLSGLTDKQKEKYLLLANRTVELGGWADELFKEFDKDILEAAGFGALIDQIFPIASSEGDDNAPAVGEVAIAKKGELYKLGDHFLMCGDACDLADVERLMQGEKARMVLTDPPYNVDYKGGMHGDGTQSKRRKIMNDKMTSEKFYQFLKSFISNAMLFTKGSFYICMSSSELHNLWKAFTDGGGHWQSYIIWAKNHFTLSHSDYHHQFEPIMYGMSEEEVKKIDESESVDGEAILYGWSEHQWYGGRKQGNVWAFDRPNRSKEHPTMKPVMLCCKAIINSSRQGEIVLDLFGGSGSTLIACEKAERKCYMMELDPIYATVILQRYFEFTGKDPIRVSDGKKYTELKLALGL